MGWTFRAYTTVDGASERGVKGPLLGCWGPEGRPEVSYPASVIIDWAYTGTTNRVPTRTLDNLGYSP